MTLTKALIIESISKETGFSKNKSTEIIETVLETIKRSAESGEDILISGFGKFSVKNKSGRRGRNPATGENMMLSPRRIITFKCSGILRAKINRK